MRTCSVCGAVENPEARKEVLRCAYCKVWLCFWCHGKHPCQKEDACAGKGRETTT